MVISHAVVTPVINTLTPTPSINQNVVLTYPGNDVATRCGQISPLESSAVQITATTGRDTSPAMNKEAKVHLVWTKPSPD